MTGKLEDVVPFDTDILVVDDIPAARRVTVRLLRSVGFVNVESAESKAEALEVMRTTEFKLVVSDLHLKDAKAMDLISEAKERYPRRKVGYLVITSDMDRQSLLDAVESGVTSYMLKPFSTGVLSEQMISVYKAVFLADQAG